jgi:hypothetical protein
VRGNIGEYCDAVSGDVMDGESIKKVRELEMETLRKPGL